ncbi:OTU domain-containing protein 4 isoform X2 [Xiphias gladius]|uniref:OTU domain-containing protein 4 isoform X2 n=1 Tax=Xiphias gladius TaxID=8245 RepID=UPI001A99C1BF|nr:OTU domain-containing protein 4 isoform X2 [Xiphias gladius]
MDDDGGGVGGGGHTYNEERGAEKMMDDYLKSLGLHRKKIAKDGSCLFRAVAEQVLHCQSLHTDVRAKCVEFLKQNRDSYEAFIEGDFEDYLCKLQDPQQWVGEVEISALAVMYKRDFLIYQEPGRPPVNITDNNFKEKVQLCFLNGNHYDSIYPISHIKNAALCQSILYEVLYNSVFKVDRSSLGVCQRIGRPNDLLSDDSMAACNSSDESDLDAVEAIWVENGTSTSSSTRHNNQSQRGRGRGRQLPERVRRSLNPTLFRNVEYDVWHKTKRAQQKMDYCIAAGMQYTVGDRCQVRLEGSGRSYNATIKEVPPNNNRVIVYIEELGKKNVSLWRVRPPSEESSWSIVVNKDKRLSNGYGDWEERGKGRGRGKPVPPASSVSQATAPGSSGRVQKQHSWPPQATVEEQGGAKPSRKSMSTAESPLFGLTEEERLAKEEEERNVALVEIQLRDEHSFPALGTGTQGDGGRRKGGEKRRSQRNKTKSPVEDVTAASPPAGERPKSPPPPLATTTAATAPTTNTTTPTSPTLPAAKPAAAPSANSDSGPAWLSSLKASTPNISTATAASGSASSLTPACAAPTAKTNPQSYASAAGAASSSPPPPAAAPHTKPSVTGGALPHSVPSSTTVFPLLTPVLPAASSPPTPPALSSSSPPPSSSPKLPTSSSSSLPPKSSASPPPPSSVPPPTFIAPIAPSPVAAQGFLPPSSLPRSSPPVTSLPHSPSPPSSCPSPIIHHADQVQEASPGPGQTPSSLPNSGGSETASQAFQSQTSLPQNQSQIPVSQTPTQASLTREDLQTQPSPPKIQAQSQASLPQSQITMPQMQTEARSSLIHLQHQPQSLTEVPLSLPQDQYPPQSQSEMVQVQSSHPPPAASYPNTSQASVPASAPVQPQPSVTHAHLHSQQAQPPHPSQLPHPSLSVSASPTHASLQTQTPNVQNQTEAPHAPAQHLHPQPESPAHPPSQQSHPPHHSHQPQLLSAHPPPPPHPQSIPGAVPLQMLSQLYQDPLYPGFPQGEKGDMALTPPYSSSRSGDDLPQDVSILRFFFNLGIKAYSMPMFPPYIYLLPLQQAHTMHPKVPSRSPSPTPHFPPSNAPTMHQEVYPQYPPTSTSVLPQYDHQAPVTELPRPSEPSFNQAGYPITQPSPHRMPPPSLPWQQHQMPPPRNSSYPVGYPPPTPTYPIPPPSSKGYHPGQGQGHLLYPPTMPPYPPSSLGYQSSPAPEELHVSQGAIERLQPANGETMSSHRPGRVPGPMEGPAAANVANANNSRTMMVPGVKSFAPKKEQGESLARVVLLVDPPIPSSTTGSPSTHGIISGDGGASHVYRVHQKPLHLNKTYIKVGAPEPGKGGYLPNISVAEALSVGCSTEDNWDEMEGFKPGTLSFRGQRRSLRGGGRGRGVHRRRGGEAGAGFNHGQFGPSHRGQRW